MNEFEKIYEKYKQDIYYYLLKMTNYNQNIAEELTQETFYQAFLSLHTFKGKCTLKTWIIQISKNVYSKYLRKNKNLFFMEEGIVDDIASTKDMVEDKILQKEAYAEALNIVNSLSKKYKDVIIFRFYYELTFKEIASILRITENSAKVLYCRGRNLLKERLRSETR